MLAYMLIYMEQLCAINWFCHGTSFKLVSVNLCEEIIVNVICFQMENEV